MTELWGQTWSRRALLERIGDVSQVGGVRRSRLLEGVSDGVEILEVETASGLSLTVLPSRGLDIGAARWQGRPLAWLSPSGFAHPAYFEERGHDGWVRAFGGGLLTTCGLLNVGEPSVIGRHAHGLHGRASSTPASEVSAGGEWHADAYHMTVRGKTREATLYGDKLEKTRTLSCTLGEPRFTLTDTVENIGHSPAPLMLLYHLNLGWPLVGPGNTLEIPSRAVEEIEGHALDWEIMPDPALNCMPCVLEHTLEREPDGSARVSVITPEFRLILTVSETLDRFTQWRCFKPGEYVLGLEPGTVGVRGRYAEQDAGTLPTLEPGESRRFALTLELEPLTTHSQQVRLHAAR